MDKPFDWDEDDSQDHMARIERMIDKHFPYRTTTTIGKAQEAWIKEESAKGIEELEQFLNNIGQGE